MKRTLSILALGVYVAACTAETTEPSQNGEDEGPVGAADEAGETGGETERSYGEGLEPGDEQPGAGDDLYASDPDALLAALPAEMRPAVVLDELKTHLLVPDLENGALALFSDVVTVEAGADVTFCTYLDTITDEVIYIHDSFGSQTKYGHHAILQYLTTPQEPGTRACPADSDLNAQLGQILGGTGGEGTSGVVLPGNVVSEVPAGAQLVINHHWINVGDEAVQAQAQMITIPPASDRDLVIARALAVVVTDFEVAPGVTGETSGECAFAERAQLLMMIGHQHQWGTHVKAERLGPSPAVIFDHDYHPEMISQPLTTDFPLEDPFVFDAGDSVRMTCQWQNTSEEALVFPREMCVFFGWQIGAEKDGTCYNGSWF